MRRRGGPGVLNTMARTAVIAGTATAVSGKVAASQHQKMAAGQAAAQAQHQAAFDAGVASAQQAAQAPVAAAPAGTDLVAELQKLAGLRDAGVLTEEEFSAAKARLIG